jgi:ABC-type oligopeptide transport system substrate-binding subunit
MERVQQGRIVLEKFADYWNAGAVHIDRIVFRPIIESTVRLANLRSDSLDLIERHAGHGLEGDEGRPEATGGSADRYTSTWTLSGRWGLPVPLLRIGCRIDTTTY